MNYSKYAAIHARHLSDKICLIERTPLDRRTKNADLETV